jgi:hypothetical protein
VALTVRDEVRDAAQMIRGSLSFGSPGTPVFAPRPA